MNHIETQNILFYSTDQRDQLSAQILHELSQNPMLDRLFYKVCVNDPNIRIPRKILELNKVPVLVANGIDKPIFGLPALSWVQNNALGNQSAGGLDYHSPGAAPMQFAAIGEQFRTPDNYNAGYGMERDRPSSFAGINDVISIETYNEAPTGVAPFAHGSPVGVGGAGLSVGLQDRPRPETLSEKAQELNRRMENLRMQRDLEAPGIPKRIGGLEQVSSAIHPADGGRSLSGSRNFPSAALPRRPQMQARK
ncbi:MAG: hypothetical protein ACYCOU_08280 [Sulfobacillus sp.]